MQFVLFDLIFFHEVRGLTGHSDSRVAICYEILSKCYILDIYNESTWGNWISWFLLSYQKQYLHRVLYAMMI